jgi:hypothetical protein
VRARRLADHRLHSVWSSKLARAVRTLRPLLHPRPLGWRRLFPTPPAAEHRGLSPKDVRSNCGNRSPAALDSPPPTPNRLSGQGQRWGAPRSQHLDKSRPDRETRTTDPRRHPARSTPNRRSDHGAGFAGMLLVCTSANRETVEKHDARAEAPPLLSSPSRAAGATMGAWELRIPRLHRSKLRSGRKTTTPPPATFASPAPTPCRRSEHGRS